MILGTMGSMNYRERGDMLRDHWAAEIDRWRQVNQPLELADFYDGGARMAAELLKPAQLNAAIEGAETAASNTVQAVAEIKQASSQHPAQEHIVKARQALKDFDYHAAGQHLDKALGTFDA